MFISTNRHVILVRQFVERKSTLKILKSKASGFVRNYQIHEFRCFQVKSRKKVFCLFFFRNEHTTKRIVLKILPVPSFSVNGFFRGWKSLSILNLNCIHTFHYRIKLVWYCICFIWLEKKFQDEGNFTEISLHENRGLCIYC